jgi:transglutaminase-like putative cysteine protease
LERREADGVRYVIQHTTTYSYTEPVPVCHNLAKLAPRDLPNQQCHDFRLAIEPEPTFRIRRQDYFGNQVDSFSIEEVHEQLLVTAESVVDVTSPKLPPRAESPPWEKLDVRHPSLVIFTLRSPRIAPSAAMREFALPSFPPGRRVFDAVRDLTSRIHEEFTFDPHATTVHTRPEELLTLRRGVCQDFAHLAIGCLRSLGLAARYVSGYVSTLPPPGQPRLMGADASHAWLSAYCGPLGWIDFDPTNDTVVGDRHITIGWGRDYGDACPIQGVFIGGGQQQMSVGVDVIPQQEAAA